jgi:hypothetical protein
MGGGVEDTDIVDALFAEPFAMWLDMKEGGLADMRWGNDLQATRR